MSLEAVTIALNHSKAKGTAKVVMIGIANHMSPDNFGAWPSQAKLANYSNVTVRGVRKAITELIALGELRVEEHGGPGDNRYRPNRYFMTLTCPEDCDRTTNHRQKQTDSRAELFDTRPELFDSQTGTFLPSEGNYSSAKPEYNRKLTIISDDEFEKPNKATRLSEDWWPDDDAWEAMRQRYPHLDLTLITESFKDYWISLPGTRARKLDWLRTWQGRVREVAGRTHGFKPKKEEINLWDMTAENE